MGLLNGRIVVVTGAGRGIGREHALEFARQGAKVVVNDLGIQLDGAGQRTSEVASNVVEEIRAAGGEAIANADDIASWDGAANLVKTAVDGFGGLDVLVNNAGFVRDRMLVSMGEQEWDDVIRVHLKGHFAPLRHAGAYWRQRSKAGEPVDARVINTSSGAGLLGSVGQGNYGAAKAGIAAMTLMAAAEMGRYGVTVNAIAPAARTRMTEDVFAETMARPDSGFDAMHPRQRLAPGGLAGQRRVPSCDRQGLRGRRRGHQRRDRLAARAPRRQGRTLGTRRDRPRRGQAHHRGS